MKLVAITYGTEGDTRPLSALCRSLLDAGHDVQLLADGATLGSAQALGVPATALAGDIRGTLSAGADRTGTANGTVSALMRLANANAEAWMRALMAAARGCDAILVSGLASFVGLSVAEHFGIRAIGLGLFPITPTRAFPSPFLPVSTLPRPLNALSHRVVNGLIWRAFRKATNAARSSLCGAPPRRKLWVDHPMLYGVSRHLVPRPDDWPENAHICGQWLLPTPDWSPPQPLADFLAAGEPPLYIGFGSMAGFAARDLLQEVIAAVAGRRALFYPGWSSMDSVDLPKNFFVLGDTPHDWLFPRTSLVIHHGGSGTSHSAARAGVPAVVVPFAGDQFFWAERLRRAGVATAVHARRLRAPVLARGIEFAESAAARSGAAALGAAMAAERGLADAVATIEALMSMASD
jgi:sterol 3beta-glucosyltransferase